MKRSLALGISLRAALLIISLVLDTYHVKFTDVDYLVFTDAATFVANGESPYNRATYRYTPLLAYLLLGNFWFTYFGKLLFIIFDLLIGGLMEIQGVDPSLWLYNPLIAIISVRGNAESFVSLIILSFLYLMKQNHFKFAAFIFGLACHVKIYPIIYAPTLLAYMNNANGSLFNRFKQCISLKSLNFFLISAFTFFVLLGFFYNLYGYKFIYETYLYHITRKDHRHNFSVYFYPLYLAQGTVYERILSLAGFFPQFILVGLIGLSFSDHLYDAVFLQTILFVAFNKVITSQYLIWYLCFVPYCLPSLRKIKTNKLLRMVGYWGVSQLMWLTFAYLLEFEGIPTFKYLWLSSLLFASSHVYFVYSYMGMLNKTKKIKSK